MAKEHSVSKDGVISNGRGVHNVTLQYIAEICRRPLIAYVAIAFAISFGFHELEQHTDRQLSRALRDGCERGNIIRIEFNNQLLVLQGELKTGSTKGSVVITPIPLTDCRNLTKP